MSILSSRKYSTTTRLVSIYNTYWHKYYSIKRNDYIMGQLEATIVKRNAECLNYVNANINFGLTIFLFILVITLSFSCIFCRINFSNNICETLVCIVRVGYLKKQNMMESCKSFSQFSISTFRGRPRTHFLHC